MKKRTISITLFSLIALSGSLQAQEDHLIENQRYVVGIDDYSWGDTYVGKYTSGNALILEEYIDSSLDTNSVVLSVDSLKIGSENNFDNEVVIYKGGELQIEGDLMVMGTTNANGLLIDNEGTLFMKSDFDASMAGFYYNSGAILKVGGEVSNLDNVEGGLNFDLTGENATWAFGTNVLTIGALSDSNSVSLSRKATLDIDNIVLGSGSTSNNYLSVTDNAKMTVRESIDILGTDNSVDISSNGTLAVYFDFSPIGNLNISEGGILEAHNNLNFTGGITNGGGIIMTGTNANWASLSGSTLNLAQSTNGVRSFLTVSNGATVRVGDFNISSSPDSSDENEILIIDKGQFIVENGGTIGSEGAILHITQGGRLVLESDYNISGSVRWHNGGIIEARGEAPNFGILNFNDEYEEYGRSFLQNGQILILNGASARLTADLDNLHVGDLSADNALIITNGGIASVNSVSVGDFKEGGNHNSIVITGTDSALNSATYAAIGGTIDSGIWYEGGVGNSITVGDGGLLSVGTTLHNRNTSGSSGLHIMPGGTVDAQDYYQSRNAYLWVYTDAGGTNAGLLRVADTAEFEAGAAIGFDSVAALAVGETYTNRIVEAGTLVVGGTTNATTSDLSALNSMAGSLVSYSLWETNQDIYATFTRRALDENADPDSVLTQIKAEIDKLSSTSTTASNQVQILSGLSEAERDRQLEQLYVYQLPTYMHNQGVFGGLNQVRARGTTFRETSKPAGAMGPGADSTEQGLQGWAKLYGNISSRDKEDFNDGYDAKIYGTVIGFDRAFNQWLFGIAGGYADSTLEGDNNDKSEASTGYGMLYASYGKQDWFGDLVLSYGLLDIENTSGSVFDVKSNTDASLSTVFIGGGKEFKDPEGSDARLRPSAGLQISQFDQDAYTEKSPNALPKQVDAYDRWSYRMTLGAQMTLPKKGTKVDWESDFRAYWLHEFNDDRDHVGYTLAESGLRANFVMIAPEQDVAQLGYGLVANWKNGLQLRADIDTQTGADFFGATLSGALLYEF